MHIIITMAGLGSRFRQVGYNCPKYMIEAKDKTLFEWSLLSLKPFFSNNDFTFISRKEDQAEAFIRGQCEHLGIRGAKIIELDHLTDGQATTAMLAIEEIRDDAPILIFNIDTYIEPGEITVESLSGDGSIPCFRAPGDHWSFVKEENGKVIDVVEKVRVSDNCSLGVYFFKNAALYTEAYHHLYTGRIQTKEKYIAPMYRYLLDQGFEVTYSIVPAERVHVLGTPEELALFLAS